MKRTQKKNTNKNEAISLATQAVKAHPFYIAILVLWGIYLYVQLNLPNTTSGQIRVSDQTLNLLRISVAIPYLLIWLSAVYAYIKIKRYAVGIRPSIESSAFDKIANAILLLFGSLILSTMLSTFRNYFINFAELRPVFTILTDYAYVLPYLFAFILFFNGTKELIRQQGNFKIPVSKYITYGIPLAFFSYIWLELIFTNPFRATPGGGSMFATYYLKDSLLVLTIIIPSLITWAIGLLVIIKLQLYYKKVKGTIYKRALVLLVNGLVGVILGSILLQALLSLGPQRLLDLGLERLLGVIYLFLFIQALGYYFIARGANKLTKIETV